MIRDRAAALDTFVVAIHVYLTRMSVAMIDLGAPWALALMAYVTQQAVCSVVVLEKRADRNCANWYVLFPMKRLRKQ